MAFRDPLDVESPRTLPPTNQPLIQGLEGTSIKPSRPIHPLNRKTQARSLAEKLRRETPNPKLRHHFQRRFARTRIAPHTSRWVAQRIQEDEVPKAVSILSAWTHPTRRVEASEATIA